MDKPQKVLVTGSNGQLGRELQTLAKTSALAFLFTDAQELDITDQGLVKDFFEKHQPDYCVNCAAYTAVDQAETDRELADNINASGAENLALGCQRSNATLIHISTDFVFDGTANVPLQEDLPTAPVNYYGESKLKGEIKVVDTLAEHFIIRTSWLYSTFGNNFVKTMLRLAETRDALNVIDDQVGTPTYARDLAQTILHIIDTDSQAYGYYHYSNEGVASWCDFAQAIFELSGKPTKAHPIPTSQYPTPAKRPAYSVMDKTKVKEAFGIVIPAWRDSLKVCLEAL